MMKSHIIILLSVIAAVHLVSCSEKQETANREYADKLYSLTCKTTLKYIDSIKNAKDSTAVESLLERYEERLVKINYDALPDTDYLLTEGQNDTIYQAIDSLRRVRLQKLQDLAKKSHESLDTIDSIKIRENVHLTSGTVKIKDKM